MGDDVPFDVIDEVVVGDLTDVKEQRSIVPPTQNVKVRVAKASVQENKTKDIKGLKLEVRIVDGIEVLDTESGVTEIKYANKPLFTNLMDLCFLANPSTRNSNWFMTKQHLVGFKKFCVALDIDVTAVKINDEFLQGLIGREVLVDIRHEEDSVLDSTSGKYVGTGTYRERLVNFKKVA